MYRICILDPQLYGCTLWSLWSCLACCTGVCSVSQWWFTPRMNYLNICGWHAHNVTLCLCSGSLWWKLICRLSDTRGRITPSQMRASTISGSLRISTAVPKGRRVWVLEICTSHQIWLKMYDGQLHLSTSNMNIVNSPTKINHVFIVSKTIYNIESDTVQMTQKIWRKRLSSVKRVEMINIPVSLWWIGAWCQTPDREQLLNVKIVLWHRLTVAEKVLGFLTQP